MCDCRSEYLQGGGPKKKKKGGKTVRKHAMDGTPASSDGDLDRQFEAAQQELAAIKSRYASAARAPRVSTPAPVAAPPAAATISLRTAGTSGDSFNASSASSASSAAATNRLEVAENVMLKLYKRNLKLENHVRQLMAELEDARKKSSAPSAADTDADAVDAEAVEEAQDVCSPEDRNLEGVKAASTTKIKPKSQRSHAPISSTNILRGSENSNPRESEDSSDRGAGAGDDVARLKRELDALRTDCARFAAKNRAVREDFNLLAQQKVESLVSSSATGHASQELLKILARRLSTVERERDADAKAFAQRLSAAEAAGRDAYVLLKAQTFVKKIP